MKLQKILKYGWLGVSAALLLAVIAFICFTAIAILTRKEHPISDYLTEKYTRQSRPFILQAFKMLANAQPGQTALVLSAELADRDVSLPLEKGYNIIVFDEARIGFELIIPNSHLYPGRIKYDWDFENPDLNRFPVVDLLMASFVLPFYAPETFKSNWQILNSKIKPGGYFIGNFFDPRFNIFKDEIRKDMTFLKKEEVLALFKDYDILIFNEVQKVSEKKTEYYYEVLARKKQR